MDLLTPGIGLIFWQIIIFGLLVILLAKYAWKPILHSLKEREDSIQQALDAAENAKREMASLKAENENLLRQARAERDKILHDAQTAANQFQAQKRAAAEQDAEKIRADGRADAQAAKQNVLREAKAQAAAISLEIASRVLLKNLSNDNAQKELAEKYLQEINLN
ncbi:MAG: ATP synthase F0 subunit B [Candidatus Nephrothrix sp. EaCA]|nr:MAG: ATP synthase F0 subunit B [Candidatus Nephrothrix sp. EaCA]